MSFFNISHKKFAPLLHTSPIRCPFLFRFRRRLFLADSSKEVWKKYTVAWLHNTFFRTTKYSSVYYFYTTLFYKVALNTANFGSALKSATKCYSVLQSIIFRTTYYYFVLQNRYSLLIHANPNYNVLHNTTPSYQVLQSSTPHYKMIILRTTMCYKRLILPTKYDKVLVRTTPYYKVLLRTTNNLLVPQRTSPWYHVLLRIIIHTAQYSLLQSTTPYD